MLRTVLQRVGMALFLAVGLAACAGGVPLEPLAPAQLRMLEQQNTEQVATAAKTCSLTNKQVYAVGAQEYDFSEDFAEGSSDDRMTAATACMANTFAVLAAAQECGLAAGIVPQPRLEYTFRKGFVQSMSVETLIQRDRCMIEQLEPLRAEHPLF